MGKKNHEHELLGFLCYAIIRWYEERTGKKTH